MVDSQDLHQKHVLGALLSTKELQQLKEWYAIQDAQEVAEIDGKIGASANDIQLKINFLFEKITQGLIQIQTITQENNEIKSTNEILRSQLIQSAS